MNTPNIISFLWSFTANEYSYVIVWLKIASAIFSLVFLIGIIYAVIHTQYYFQKYRARFGLSAFPVISTSPPSGGPSQKNISAWQEMMRRAQSEDENDRKFGIIAADSLLDRILERAGYRGENLGARLKQIEPSDLITLNDLWEAHKVRNRIAHEAHYRLSMMDARSAMERYEKTLKELKFL